MSETKRLQLIVAGGRRLGVAVDFLEVITAGLAISDVEKVITNIDSLPTELRDATLKCGSYYRKSNSDAP